MMIVMTFSVSTSSAGNALPNYLRDPALPMDTLIGCLTEFLVCSLVTLLLQSIRNFRCASALHRVVV